MTIFGESHGPAIGLRWTGCRPTKGGNRVCTTSWNAGRRAGISCWYYPQGRLMRLCRQSGVLKDIPLARRCAPIPNGNQHSGDYQPFRQRCVPAMRIMQDGLKYQGFNDYRVAGHFSGYDSAAGALGALCKLALRERQVVVGSHIVNIGAATDRRFNLWESRSRCWNTIDSRPCLHWKQQLLPPWNRKS